MSHNNLIPIKFYQEFLSDLNCLSDVLLWFNQVCQPLLPEPICLKAELALVEGFTNAVRHAHKALPPSVVVSIELDIVTQDRLEIRINDLGPGFNLEEKLKNLSDTIDLDASSGRGLLILFKVAEYLSYTRNWDGNGNCLLIGISI